LDIGEGEDEIHPLAKDLIEKFLEPNPRKRLGHGVNGIRNIMKHPYFKGL